MGYEKLPNISQDEMIRLLELGDEGVIEIVKLVCEQDENKNFYKLNMNKNNISFLSNQYKIDICQETELKKTLGSVFKFSKVKKEPKIPKKTIP